MIKDLAKFAISRNPGITLADFLLVWDGLDTAAKEAEQEFKLDEWEPPLGKAH